MSVKVSVLLRHRRVTNTQKKCKTTTSPLFLQREKKTKPCAHVLLDITIIAQGPKCTARRKNLKEKSPID